MRKLGVKERESRGLFDSILIIIVVIVQLVYILSKEIGKRV